MNYGSVEKNIFKVFLNLNTPEFIRLILIRFYYFIYVM